VTRKAARYNAAWGLEFGGSAIRLVRVTRSNGGYRADDYQEVAMEERWDRAAALAEAVRRLKAPAIEPPLAVCMPDELALFRTMDLPAVSSALEKMVLRQTEVLLPGQGDLFATGWAHHPHPLRRGQEHVTLWAARKDVLSRLTQAAQSLVSGPSAILPSSVALAGGWARLSDELGGLLALLDVGAKSTALIWLLDGNMLSGGVLDQGGDQWTLAIAQKLGIDARAAEALKIEVARGGAATDQAQDRAAARDILADSLTQWAQQLAEVHQGCRQSLGEGRRPDRCLIFGRAARTPGLVESVRQTLGLEAQLAQAPARLSLAEGVSYAPAATAIGAALCQLEPKPAVCQLHFGPAEAPRLAVPKSARRWALALGWLLAAVLTLYGLDAFEAHWLKAAMARVHAAIGQGQDMERQLAVGRYLDQAGAPPLTALGEISSLAPAQAILNTWRYSRSGDIALAGTVPSEQELHGFMKKLSESAIFRDVTLLNAKSDSGRCRFEISLKLRSGARTAASGPATEPSSRPSESAPASGGAGAAVRAPDATGTPAGTNPASQPARAIGGPS